MNLMTYEERLEAYRKLKAKNEDEPLRFFADHFGVNIGTVSRWNKALKKLDIKGEALDELRAKIEKEMEAKYKGLYDNKEQERAEKAAAKAEAEKRATESRHAHSKRIMDEAELEEIWPDKTVDVTWQGHRMTLIGGQKNMVPSPIAGVWRESQKAKQQAALTASRYGMGQYLGKLPKT